MTQAFLECACPPGHDPAASGHHAGCAMANPDAAVICPPDSDCCAEPHDHAAAANACPGRHDGEPCPDPADKCRTWKGAIADARHPQFAGGHPLFAGTKPPDCPGGHCHKDLPGCTVCRPLIITAPSGGHTSITPVAG